MNDKGSHHFFNIHDYVTGYRQKRFTPSNAVEVILSAIFEDQKSNVKSSFNIHNCNRIPSILSCNLELNRFVEKLKNLPKDTKTYVRFFLN